MLLFIGVWLYAAPALAAESGYMNPFDPVPPNAYAWRTSNPDINHGDGPFALPGAPNPLNLQVLNPRDFQWGSHQLCAYWHLHGPFGGHGDPAPGPPLTDSPCGHGGLIYLLGAGGFVPAGNAEFFCPIDTYEGRFQPSQGVWQDDPVFADAPSKQITQPDAFAPNYVAELDMVKNRDAYLVGTERPVGRANMPGARDVIFLRGQSWGAGVVQVKIRFTLREGGQVTWTHDDPTVHDLPIGKPCAPAPGPFNAQIAAGTGIPATGAPFKFTQVGNYELEAELVLMDGTPTGIKAVVQGETVENNGVKALIIPYVFSAQTDTEPIREELHDTAMTFSSQAMSQLPDWYPIKSGDFSTEVAGTNIGIINDDYLNRTSADMTEPMRSVWKAKLREELFRKTLTHVLSRTANMAGNGRVLTVFKRSDYNLVDSKGLQGFIGLAASDKVIYLADDAVAKGKLVAHELAHTIPAHLWPAGTDNHDPACGIVFHNQPTNVAHGLRIRDRKRMNGVLQVMGLDAATADTDVWIDQCTYWHLVENLDAIKDPPVILVSGFLVENGSSWLGGFTPFYQFNGFPDLVTGTGGDYAVVLRDAGGAELGRFPFSPAFQLPHRDAPEDLVSFAHQVPDLPGVARIDLVGPDGLLETRVYSPHAPSVALTVPASQGAPIPTANDRVTVEWSGQDLDGDPLVYSVLYSANGGQTWAGVADFAPGPSVSFAFDPAASAHRVRVLVSDGERSAQAESAFQIGACADGDADGLCNAADNCPFFATANASDVDADGRGDACECTDQTGDGRNTVADLVAINLAIFNPALVTPLCDGNGDGACNVGDIIAANVEIFSPSNTSICVRQPVPGP